MPEDKCACISIGWESLRLFHYFITRTRASSCLGHLLLSILGLCICGSLFKHCIIQEAFPLPSDFILCSLTQQWLSATQLSFWPFVALTGLRGGLLSPFAYCMFLTRDSRAHQSRNAVCSVLITSGCSGQHKACGHFVLVEWMNEFINDCQKNKLFRLDTVFDFYRFEHIRFSLGFLKRVSHWKIILLFLIQLPVDGLKYLSYFKLSIPFCLCIRTRIPPGQCFTIFFTLFAPI